MASRVRVLLVENNPDDAHLLKTFLEASRDSIYSFQQVDRLSVAIEKGASSEFDVVLLDLALPDSRSLDVIWRNAGRLQKLVSDVLGLTRVRSFAADVFRRPINMSGIVDEVAAAYRARASDWRWR